MSTASMGMARGDGRDNGGTNTSSRIGMALALLAVIALLAAWFFGWFASVDPRVAEVRQMQQEAREKFTANGGPSTPAEAAAVVASMQQIREKVEGLPENLRQQVERGGRNAFRSTMRARIDAYFAAAPEKRKAELDRQIKQEELMRKAFEQAGIGGGGGGGPPGGQQGGGPPGGGGGPPRGGTEEDRNRWRKNMIDSTSPDQRARYVEYRRAMDKRREELGLPPRGPR